MWLLPLVYYGCSFMHHVDVGYWGLKVAHCYDLPAVIFVATHACVALLSLAKMHLEGACLDSFVKVIPNHRLIQSLPHFIFCICFYRHFKGGFVAWFEQAIKHAFWVLYLISGWTLKNMQIILFPVTSWRRTCGIRVKTNMLNLMAVQMFLQFFSVMSSYLIRHESYSIGMHKL